MRAERPRIADLFCGAGGAAKGLDDAGFEVVGFDREPQPRYPYEFHQRDVVTLSIAELLAFDALWASPPCQAGSRVVLRSERGRYPMLIEPTRLLLEATGLPYIIENVAGAPVRPDVKLCGLMFGLPLIRHRWFESNILLLGPRHQPHGPWSNHKSGLGSYSTFDGGAKIITVAGHVFRLEDGKRAMGIDWMRKSELAQAIPPVYSECLGRQLIRYVEEHEPDRR